MQPPTFDDFLKNHAVSDSEEHFEELSIAVCPTPGCHSHSVHPFFSGSQIAGFTCGNGCRFTSRRNAFTNEIIYYRLDETNPAVVGSTVDVRGMKFNVMGEPYTDWY
jgi:hypothetical protein